MGGWTVEPTEMVMVISSGHQLQVWCQLSKPVTYIYHVYEPLGQLGWSFTFNNLRECSLLVVRDVGVSMFPHVPTCTEWWCSSCKMLKLVETPFLFQTCWLRNPQLQTMDRNFRDYPPQTNVARGNPRKTLPFTKRHIQTVHCMLNQCSVTIPNIPSHNPSAPCLVW